MSASRRKVLIVDDDEGIALCLRLALEARGFDVVMAHDGNEGLGLIEREAPDLVVLDVVMPRRTGFAVLERIRRRTDGSPRVIVVTGNDEPRHRQFAASRGADAFLGKPYEMPALIAEVERQLALVASGEPASH